MKNSFRYFAQNKIRGSILASAFLIASIALLPAAELKKARVSQVIQDVKVLGANAPARPASVNDNVGEGMAVRTGTESRAELTFTDLTITRLGANSIFSFKEGTREIKLDSGSILVQVPPNAPAARIKTPAVTAAITGGTAMLATGPPTKYMVMEGTGTFFANGHPEQAIILGPGEMTGLTANGRIIASAKFDVAKVVATAALIADFPELPSLPLIRDVIVGQVTTQQFLNPPPITVPIDVVSQRADASPTPTPTPTPSATPSPTPSATPSPTPSATPVATPSKFGTPSVIASPNPYVITSGTTISTDPAITTNGVTDYGKIYRGPSQDGFPSDYLYGSTTAFDMRVFNNPGNPKDLPIAVFKFAGLQLAGDPPISLANGGASNLALVSVGNITSGAPGGTLTFAGIDRLFIGTQNGSINLGPEISFSGMGHLNFYARGAGSALVLASPVSNVGVLKLYAEGSIQVNGNESVGNFEVIAATDFLAGTGLITPTGTIDIRADHNLNFNVSQFPESSNIDFSVTLDAGNVVNIDVRGDQTVFSNADSVQVTAPTINLIGDNPTAVNFNQNASLTSFSAGTGGIQASTVALGAPDLMLSSQGDINVYGVNIPSINGTTFIQGTISATGAFNSISDVVTGDLSAGTTITVGGNLFMVTTNAGTTINVTGDLSGFDSVTAGGNINANSVAIPTINAPNGILTVGSGGIHPFVFSASSGPQGAIAQHTINISSIISPNGIDFSGNQFNDIGGFSSGGLLTINATTITFDPASGIGFTNFNGADAGSFSDGGPPSGGDGGVLIVNTTGPITVNSDIEASTGLQPTAASPSGNGGTVNLNSSSDTVTVNSRIEVSSIQPSTGSVSRVRRNASLASIASSRGRLHTASSPGPAAAGSSIRHSAKGGNIGISSGKTSGVAINISSSAQLLSLLDSVAPGPGGNITIVASRAGGNTGNNSQINIDNSNGQITAHRGTIEVRHDGDAGQITLTNANMAADVVKVGALGSNGTLTIGGGSISADTILKLYAPGSNGQLIFVANVTLSSGTAMHLAANTITIRPTFVVTIAGAGGPANIYTNHPNYNFTPGPGYTGPPGVSGNGSFGGNRAHDPQPLGNAPGF